MSEWNKIKEEIELLSKSKNGSPKEGKKQKIAYHFKKIMEELDLDLSDDSLAKTPERVAKMYVDELFSGLDEKNEPSISQFENNYKYKGIILEKDIQLYSICEHHFVPIIGKAHVAYFANEKIIGLSKINRVVSYFSKRPQVQEKLTVQIVNYLKKVLETENVACVIEAQHLCVSMRGIKDESSLTTTAEYSGKFLDQSVKNEFLTLLSK
ncbi:MAG: GTP cyclohydrolase I FolE [Crocinitomicaceae bacterium]|nr:GTP cyclohydrolase I FolE [Crocinitomicaceae bacterium]|tara:strand:- start:8 stop:637 length:630 start_codon:yes stop_codon:yes gene_type:complete